MVVVDSQGRVVLVNQQAEQLFGYERAELVGQAMELLLPERLRDSHARTRAKYTRAPHTRPMGVGLELVARRRDGSELPVEISLSPMHSDNDVLIISAIRDVSTRKHTEAELYRHHGFVQLLHQVASTANATTSVEKAVQQVLAQVCNHLGWPIGRAVFFAGDAAVQSPAAHWHLAEPERFASLQATLEQAAFNVHGSLVRQARESARPTWLAGTDEHAIGVGVALPVLVGAEVVAVLAFFTARPDAPDMRLLDVLAQIGIQIGRVIERARVAARLEEQQRALAERLNATEAGMLQAARLAAVGQLAASIAHEINNPLYAARNCLALLEQETPEGAQASPFLGIARDELARIARIIERMREFYRPDRGTLAPCDIHGLIAETLELAGLNLHDQSIRVVFSPASNLPAILANGGQLRQVFLNLVLNAIEAMPAGGVLTVRTSVAAGATLIEVQDTGVGIPDDIRPRLFEPFFTNKSNGTGLGLSISAHIVTQHGGRIEVESIPGQGSTFRVILPLRAAR
jgi:PAS domain S-box-containing protein